MNNLILFYVTNESVEEAKKIARHLLQKRLIGCANIHPISSLYWWQGEVVDDNEVVLIAKTVPEKAKEVREEIAKIHPFDTPCIIKLVADPNQKYLDWIQSELE